MDCFIYPGLGGADQEGPAVSLSFELGVFSALFSAAETT